jgi:hypothetical protein
MGWGFSSWLDGSLECPDQSLYPDAHRVWKKNDHIFREFILEHISVDDYQQVYRLNNCHEIFEELRKRHELLGIYAQAALFKKAFDIQFRYDTPLSETILEIRLIHERTIKMGALTPDRRPGYLHSLLSMVSETIFHTSDPRSRPWSRLPVFHPMP